MTRDPSSFCQARHRTPDHLALDRTDISTILRENLEYCGISEEAIKTFGSHSPRRGGACAHIAAGADPEAVKRLGRWVGDT